MIAATWYFDRLASTREPVPVGSKTLKVADGDSFSAGTRKLRLDGIDAPEYAQTCKDANGAAWECGKAARAALEQLLREPGLACNAEAQDKYARSIANCGNGRVPDIAAVQVANGMAVSHEFHGVRSYGDEEDAARAARRGIWVGEFMPPNQWRAIQATLRTNTQPAE
jgi:endonuclease YncB( thermonuclease family)